MIWFWYDYYCEIKVLKLKQPGHLLSNLQFYDNVGSAFKLNLLIFQFL